MSVVVVPLWCDVDHRGDLQARLHPAEVYNTTVEVQVGQAGVQVSVS